MNSDSAGSRDSDEVTTTREARPAVKVRDEACMLTPNSGAKSRLGLSYPGKPEVVRT